MTDPVPAWVHMADVPPDPEPWSWSCPRCTASLPRDLIRAHLDDHDARPEAVIVWVALAVAIAVAVVAWLVWPRG